MNTIPRYKVTLVKESEISLAAYPRYGNSRDVFEAFREEFAQLDREEFHVITVDNKNRMIGLHRVSVGTLSTTIVQPREVYKSALLHNAAAVLLLHNHPSGDPAPSAEDRQCTARLLKAGAILGIKVLDHIVLGESDYFSFADAGLLNSEGCHDSNQ